MENPQALNDFHFIFGQLPRAVPSLFWKCFNVCPIYSTMIAIATTDIHTHYSRCNPNERSVIDSYVLKGGIEGIGISSFHISNFFVQLLQTVRSTVWRCFNDCPVCVQLFVWCHPKGQTKQQPTVPLNLLFDTKYIGLNNIVNIVEHRFIY